MRLWHSVARSRSAIQRFHSRSGPKRRGMNKPGGLILGPSMTCLVCLEHQVEESNPASALSSNRVLPFIVIT